MKLLYLYIEDFRCFSDQEFNFDSKYRFHLDKSDPKKWELIKDNVENPLPDDFWSSSTGKHNVVESVSAIVGKNGSGKTSIANFLANHIGFHGEEWKFLVVFKYREDVIPQGWTNLTKIEKNEKCKINLKRITETDSLFKPLPIIYFSPFFTTENVFDINRNIDISTSSLLTESNSPIKVEQFLENYKSKEYIRGLTFLYRYYTLVKTQKIHVTLPEPEGILITINIRYIIEFIYSEKASTLHNLLAEFDNIKWNNPKTMIKTITDYLIKYNKINTKAGLIAYLKSIFIFVKEDIFLVSFVCYIISFWKQYVAQKRNNYELFFSDINKKAIDVVIDYICILNNTILDESSPKSYVEILETIKSNDQKTFDFFKLFNEFLTFQNITKKYDENKKEFEVTFEYSDFEEIKNNFLEMVIIFNNINLNMNFIVFNFAPNMSSGEMSFLTIFSRIIDCLNNHKKIKNRKEFILILDEAETTLHPECQQKLVSWIITFFEEFLEDKKVHIIFGSHSPILLSDIPDSNVVFLKKDPITKKSITVDHEEIGKTFGSNIYTLYKKSFFLNDGLMGEFAEQKIEDIIKDLLALELKVYSGNRENRYQELKQEIELIGEPVIHNQLKDRLKWVQMRNKWDKKEEK